MLAGVIRAARLLRQNRTARRSLFYSLEYNHESH
jgi:hypothetical protein